MADYRIIGVLQAGSAPACLPTSSAPTTRDRPRMCFLPFTTAIRPPDLPARRSAAAAPAIRRPAGTVREFGSALNQALPIQGGTSVRWSAAPLPEFLPRIITAGPRAQHSASDRSNWPPLTRCACRHGFHRKVLPDEVAPGPVVLAAGLPAGVPGQRRVA